MALLRAHGFEAAVGARNFCSLEPAGAHLVRGVLAPSAVFRAEELSSAYGSRVAFSLRGQRESNPRERPPRLALAGLLPGKSVSRGRAFRTGILPVQKGVDIPVDSRFAACRPRLTAAQGPRVERRAILARTRWKAERHGSNSSSNSENESGGEAQLCNCSIFAPALLKTARRMRAALPGHPLKRRVGEGKPAGWFAWMRTSLASVHGEGMDAQVEATQGAVARWTVDKPRSPHADFPGMDARKARKRGGLLFGYLSLGHARESDSPSAGGRKLFALSQRGATQTSRRKSLPQMAAQTRC